MSLSLLKQIGSSWSDSKGPLRRDLERIQTGMNQYISANDQRWDDLFITENPVVQNGSAGARLTIDWSKGPFQRVKLTANITFAFVFPVDGNTYTLLIDTGVGAFTGTWPSSVKWAGGAPTLTVTANRWDIVTLRFVKALNFYFGSIQQNYQ